MDETLRCGVSVQASTNCCLSCRILMVCSEETSSSHADPRCGRSQRLSVSCSSTPPSNDPSAAPNWQVSAPAPMRYKHSFRVVCSFVGVAAVDVRGTSARPTVFLSIVWALWRGAFPEGKILLQRSRRKWYHPLSLDIQPRTATCGAPDRRTAKRDKKGGRPRGPRDHIVQVQDMFYTPTMTRLDEIDVYVERSICMREHCKSDRVREVSEKDTVRKNAAKATMRRRPFARRLRRRRRVRERCATKATVCE